MAYTGTYKNEGESTYVNSSGVVAYFHYTFNPENEKFESLELAIMNKSLKLEHAANPKKTGNKFNFDLYLHNDAAIGTLILDVENDEFDINLTSDYLNLTEGESDDENMYKHGKY